MPITAIALGLLLTGMWAANRTVGPQLASDVSVGRDLGWSMAGLVVVLAMVVGLGINGERNSASRAEVDWY